MSDTSKGFNLLSSALIFILILFVAATASFATYSWQHHKVNSLNERVNNLNSQISNLNNQVTNLSLKVRNECQQTQQLNTNCARYTYTSPKGVSILVYTPAKNSAISSPVAVVGEVPGNWSFEAQFPVQIKNSKGIVVAQASAQLLGNWQTSQLVPFSVLLTYKSAESGSGTIVLQKDNPSGLLKNEDSVTVPINF